MVVCCLQILAETVENLHREGLDDPFYQPVHTFILNPKSITMEELYGGVDKLTMEWHDGLMGITVRNAVQVCAVFLLGRVYCRVASAGWAWSGMTASWVPGCEILCSCVLCCHWGVITEVCILSCSIGRLVMVWHGKEVCVCRSFFVCVCGPCWS